MEHPRVKFAVYTSIMEHNVIPLIEQIFRESADLSELEIYGVFD